MAAPRVTIDQLPEQTAAVGTDLLVVQNGATTKKMTVGKITDVPAADLAAHVAATTDAHDSTAVSVPPNVDPMSGTDVGTQLGQAAEALSLLSPLVGSLKVVALTQAAYDALPTKDPATLYVVTD